MILLAAALPNLSLLVKAEILERGINMTEYGYHFDYSKTMMMKMFLAMPDPKGGSRVLIDFESALDIIRRVDNITQGIPKIIYLVGWQYNGHDDRYPDLFEANAALARGCDTSARDSLLWLIESAKKYHTIVSLHINFTDAYVDSEYFDRLKEARALIRDKAGNDTPVENYNGKDCYKISFKEEWNSGIFKEIFNRFIEYLPIIKEQKTVHVDNFQCYYNFNPDIDVKEMQSYRIKMIEYVRSFGIDVTSEGTYREGEAGKDNFNCHVPPETVLTYPIACLNHIAASWWQSAMSDFEHINIPPQQYCGGLPDDEYFHVIYGNMHGEDVWQKCGTAPEDWEPVFIKKFITEQIPFRFLLEHKRLKFETVGEHKRLLLEDNISSDGKERAIYENGIVRKHGNNVLLPAVMLENTYMAFNETDGNKIWQLPESGYTVAEVYRICGEGNQYIENVGVTDGRIAFNIGKNEGLLLKLK